MSILVYTHTLLQEIFLPQLSPLTSTVYLSRGTVQTRMISVELTAGGDVIIAKKAQYSAVLDTNRDE